MEVIEFHGYNLKGGVHCASADMNQSRNTVYSTQGFRFLGVDEAGMPYNWLTKNEAITLYGGQGVAWDSGEVIHTAMGGHQSSGERSAVPLRSVIAARGINTFLHRKIARPVPLTNDALFRRDACTCMYCGETHTPWSRLLTRDHVIATSRNGQDVWSNVVTACFSCNNTKADKTPEEAGMHLLAVPYAPNYAEDMIMRNRSILADQMEFLLTHVPHVRRHRFTSM